MIWSLPTPVQNPRVTAEIVGRVAHGLLELLHVHRART